MSASNRIQNYSQSRSITFRSSERNNANRTQHRGNNPNRLSINEGSNARDGGNQRHQRFNRQHSRNQNASPNSNNEVANRDFTPNARSKQNNEQNWISYCQIWQDYILKGRPCFLSLFNNSPIGLNNYNNGSPTVGGNSRCENTATSYSSVVGSSCQPLQTTPNSNAIVSSASNLVSNTQATSPLLPDPTGNVSPEAVSAKAVGEPITSIAAEEAVNDSSHSTANASSSHSYNYGQRYSDGYNRPRRGNHYGGNKLGYQGGYRYGGRYSQNRNVYHTRFAGDHIPTQAYPSVLQAQYDCHVPISECQACFNYVHPYQYGIPQFYQPMAQYVIAAPVHQNSFQDPSVAAASSLPNTPSSTPSDASANSEPIALNLAGNMKLPQSSEKPYQLNSGSFIGPEPSQNFGISAAVPNAVAMSRSVPPPSMLQTGEQMPVAYYHPQQILVPANAGEMPGFVVDPQYVNYVNEAGCLMTQPVMYIAPNYASELNYHNEH